MSIKSTSHSTHIHDSRLYDQPKVEPTVGLEMVETSPPSQVVPELCNIEHPVPTKTSPIQYFHLDKLYTWCALFVSLGGFMFGFDTGSIGPVIVMHQFANTFGKLHPTSQGLVVSSILLPAAVTSIIAGPLSDRISRTRTFTLGGAVFAIGVVLECASINIAMLFVGRCLSGIGEGLFLSTITVYICEIAPTAIRGRLSCTVQLFVTIGIASGYFVSYGSVHASSSFAWRCPFMIQSIVASVFTIGSCFLPHSPRWLSHVGREAEAAVTWSRLGLLTAEAEKEQDTVRRSEEQQAQSATKSLTNVAKLLWGKDLRLRTFLVCFMMGFQQLSGIDGVLYYAPILFSQAGLSSAKASFLASGVSGLLSVAVTIITQFYSDKWGRRSSIVYGGAVISCTMLLIATLYASKATDHAAGRWAVVCLIYLFIIAFGMSWAVVIRIVSSEIHPIQTRAAASSFGQFANWTVNWVIAFTTPLFLSKSSSGPYFLFGSCTLLVVIVSFALLPESRGVSLENLDSIFEVSPWKKHVNRAKNFSFAACGPLIMTLWA